MRYYDVGKTGHGRVISHGTSHDLVSGIEYVNPCSE